MVGSSTGVTVRVGAAICAGSGAAPGAVSRVPSAVRVLGVQAHRRVVCLVSLYYCLSSAQSYRGVFVLTRNDI